MRALVLASLLWVAAGCPGPIHDGQTCSSDADCGGDVCAHDMQCFPADQVHAVTIRWTINGAPPSAATCAGISLFEVGYRIGFDDTTRVFYNPVPCAAGSFPNDKWPIAYDTALVAANAGIFDRPIPPVASADVTVDVVAPPAP
jgi:hypothetical protein